MTRFVLILLRHGHAEDGQGGTDHARRLSAQGLRETRAVGPRLADPAWRPAHALVSDATRTETTFQQVAGALDGVTHDLRPELYLGGESAIRRALAERTDVTRVLVVGHNPTLSELATRLTLDYVALGTAEAVVLAVDAASWDEAVQLDGSWELVAELGP